jgi:fumarylacetoacetate (FAA) hydrolase family protein
MKRSLEIHAALPADADTALLIGRVHLDGTGPMLVQVTPDGVYDLSGLAATCSELLELPDVAASVREGRGARIAGAREVLANSAFDARAADRPWFLAPCDLQAVKAAGVTFVASMLERVIEEQARGDPSRAEAVRQAVVAVIGDDLAAVQPGSASAARLKDVRLSPSCRSRSPSCRSPRRLHRPSHRAHRRRTFRTRPCTKR